MENVYKDMWSRLVRRGAWVILALTFIGTLLVFPFLPPVIATHWDSSGTVSGTMSSFAGAFLLPVIMLAIFFLFSIIPRIDPMRENIQAFRKEYDTFVALFLFVFAGIHAALLAFNLGAHFDVMYVVLPLVGALMYYVGSILPKTKRNWFIGIRTPWTISSDYVWEKTHALGGTLFKILGVVIFCSVIVPEYALIIIFVPLCVFIIGLVLYSYRLYERYRIDLNDVS